MRSRSLRAKCAGSAQIQNDSGQAATVHTPMAATVHTPMAANVHRLMTGSNISPIWRLATGVFGELGEASNAEQRRYLSPAQLIRGRRQIEFWPHRFSRHRSN
jgi:hypothetical protein